jgi:hypothetical protein
MQPSASSHRATARPSGLLSRSVWPWAAGSVTAPGVPASGPAAFCSQALLAALDTNQGAAHNSNSARTAGQRGRQDEPWMRVRACRRATSSAPSAARSDAAGAAAAAVLPASAAAGGVPPASAQVAAARESVAATGAALAALLSGEGAPVNDRSRGASCLAPLPGLRSAERRTPVTAGAACSSAAMPVAHGARSRTCRLSQRLSLRRVQGSADRVAL